MKKICFIASAVYTIGGEQSVLALIANELCKRYDVTIYTHENKCKTTSLLEKLQAEVKVVYVPKVRHGFVYVLVAIFNRFFRKLFNNKFAQYLMKCAYYPKKTLNYWIKEININNYDTVITVSGSKSYSIMLGYIKHKINAKVIAWEHSSYEAYFSYPSSYYYNRKSAFINEVRKLDKCVVLNSDISNKYMENLGIETIVIHNPCKPLEKVENNCYNKQFIACGRLEEEKGYEGLIDAFNIFFKENQEWRLVLLGDGSKYEVIRKKIEKYGLQNNVIMMGYKTDVSKYYSESSIFLMTSKWEGFPMTVLEAFQSGLPIIAFNIPAMQPLVDNGKEGYLIEPENYNAFAKKMILLASSPNEIYRMSFEARKKAKLFSIENIVAKWIKLIES